MKTAPVYLTWNGELPIDAPLSVVWSHVLRYPSWQNFSILDRVAGEKDQEGEIVVLKKIEAGFDFPPYYARTVKIDPERRIIWKCYQHETSPMSFFGFVEFVLTAVGGGTRFGYNIVYEFMIEHSEEVELEDFKAKQSEGSQKVFDSIFPKLKRLSETGRL